MNNFWNLLKKLSMNMAGRARMVWSKIGSKSTSKVATWASKNKTWLANIGIGVTSAAAGALVSKVVAGYIENKEDVGKRWMDQTNESTPERASARKRVKVLNELRTRIDTLRDYSYDESRDDEYTECLIRTVELVNMLAFHESDDDVRRIATRSCVTIPGCLQSGQMPEEGFSSPLVLRALRNLSENALSAEDIEGAIDSLLDIAESGAPLKSV